MPAVRITHVSGFIIQVQDEGDNVIGEFEIPAEMDDFKSYKCGSGSATNMVAHNNPKDKKMVTAVWLIPNALPTNSQVFVKATVVKQKSEFWALKSSIRV